ncbi:hypothetical protein, partial [Pseudomonas gessardii]
MYLRLLWLILCTLSSSTLAQAALPTFAPHLLTSQTHIDRQGIGISTQDWHWLRHKAELRIGISPDESAPFSVNAESNQYEGI